MSKTGRCFLTRQEGFLLGGEPDLDPPDDQISFPCGSQDEWEEEAYDQEALLAEWEAYHPYPPYDWGE